jgi:hypothetical protein
MISAPDEVLDTLQAIAAERQVSLDDVIREALAEKVARDRPLPRSLGSGDSGRTDTARLAGEVRREPRAWR